MDSLLDFFFQGHFDAEDLLRHYGSYLAVLAALAGVVLIPLAIYYLFSLPMRRMQRARLFLDVLEQGLRSGRSLEQVVIGVARTGDRALGRRFEQAGELMSRGVPWDEALHRVPNFLPSAVLATLQAGVRLGAMEKVLPLCHRMLGDARSRTQSAFQISGAVPWMLLPVMPQTLAVLATFVLPRFGDITRDLTGRPAEPGGLSLLFAVICLFQLALTLALLAGMFLYVMGPWIRRFLQSDSFPYIDWLLLQIPWRRTRVLRDFGSLLAAALDAGLPEAEALRVAADGTGNQVVIRRAERVRQALSNGIPFQQAFEKLWSRPELSWRLGLAARSKGGFVAALQSWWQCLDVQSYRQEQTASQLTACGLIVVSGISVAGVCLCVFLPIIQIIEQVALW